MQDIHRLKLSDIGLEGITKQLMAIRVPTAAEQQQQWFGDGGELVTTITNTAEFLVAQGIIDAVAPSYAAAVNRSYLDAALAFLPAIELRALIRAGSVTLGALLPSPMWTGNGALALAVDRVNADPLLLPGRTLLYSSEFGCSASEALKGFGKLDGHSIDALIGATQ